MDYSFIPCTKFIRAFTGILLGMLLAGTAVAAGNDAGQAVLDRYTAPDKLAQPRLESIRPFIGTVKEEPLPKSVADSIKAYKSLTVKAYSIDGIHICDAEWNDGKKNKPLLIYLHGGWANRAYLYERGVNEKKEFGKATFANYAEGGFRLITLDAAGLGASEAGPIDAFASNAETVGYIDRIIEYFNTVDNVDATKFVLHGFSMGGNTAYAYVTHGSYKPVAVICEASIPDFSDLAEGPMYDSFGAGRSFDSPDYPYPSVMSREQIQEFARRYSPIRWPEKFEGVYLIAGNGTDDTVQPPASAKLLESKLRTLGYRDFHFELIKENHWHVDYIRKNALALLKRKLDFVRIKAGTFMMGADSGAGRDDDNAHSVTLTRDFYMCDHEVTQDEYEAVMGKNRYTKEAGKPMVRIDWFAATDYCNKLSEKEGLTPCYTKKGKTVTCDFTANGYRLPTEAEWEYAARAGDNTTDRETWSGTNEESLLGEYAWYLDNSGGTIQPVKGKKPNAWGLYDMSGNVWEWCWDAYSIYSGESETDPTGPASGSRRIRRGGGYDGSRPVFFRQPTDQKLNKSDMTGFRVVRTAVSE